jgi:arylsulfatase
MNCVNLFLGTHSEDSLAGAFEIVRIAVEPFTPLRVPKLYDLHADPYEKADITSNTYYDWFISHAYIMYGAQALTRQFLETFKDFPPAQRPGSFNVDQAVAKLREQIGD